jgi:hypothetical protein
MDPATHARTELMRDNGTSASALAGAFSPSFQLVGDADRRFGQLREGAKGDQDEDG